MHKVNNVYTPQRIKTLDDRFDRLEGLLDLIMKLIERLPEGKK